MLGTTGSEQSRQTDGQTGMHMLLLRSLDVPVQRSERTRPLFSLHCCTTILVSSLGGWRVRRHRTATMHVEAETRKDERRRLGVLLCHSEQRTLL